MKTIAFYSYKGGVGRSLALVNVATRLAEFGKKVCVMDFDLEAPGLHLKFPISKNYLNSLNYQGIVDCVYDFAKNGVVPKSVNNFTININVSKNASPIILMPAGNINSSDYWKKLSSINWYELMYENDNGMVFFLKLKSLIKNDIMPDFLLIDSRTGISEMSGITLSLLADEVVVVAANNKENLSGAKRVINSITEIKNSVLGNVPKVTFVLSRIPFTDKPEDKEKENILINRIKREYLFPKITEVNVIHSDRELEENEQVKIAYERDETTAQSSKDYLSLFEKLTVDDLSDIEIKRFRDIRESQRLYTLAANENSSQQKLDYLNKAIELNKNNIDLYIYRARILNEVQQYEKSEIDIRFALSLNDSFIPAHQLLIQNLYDSKKYKDALKEVEVLLSLNPRSSYGLDFLGIIFTTLGELSKAESAYSEMIQKDPEDSRAYSGRGNVYRLKGEYELAFKDIYKSLELESENVAAVATLAELYAHKKDFDAFFVHFENALKLDPEYLEKVIQEENVYLEFYENERFIYLLAKYGIYLP